MKSIFNKIINYLRSRKRRRKILNVFKTYLENGTYFFDNNTIKKMNFNFTNIRNEFRIYSIKKNNMLIRETIILFGTYKVCIVAGDKIIAWCSNKKIYLMNKQNYLDFSKEFPYPHAITYSFEDNKQIIVSEYLKGERYKDYTHIILWAKREIEYAKNANMEIKRGIIYYVQHGDSWYDNIVWISDSDFKYIDLDRIGMWPAMYDIIYGLTVSLKSEAFDVIENVLYYELSMLFESFNVKFTIETIDIYLSEFIKIWKLRDKKIALAKIEPFSVLDGRKYPNTYKEFIEWNNENCV